MVYTSCSSSLCRADDAGDLLNDPGITSTAVKLLIAEVDMDTPENRYALFHGALNDRLTSIPSTHSRPRISSLIRNLVPTPAILADACHALRFSTNSFNSANRFPSTFCSQPFRPPKCSLSPRSVSP